MAKETKCLLIVSVCFFLLSPFLLSASAYSLDRTPPTTPVVTDDGDFTTSTSTLHAVWSSTDPESGIRQYKYAIGTAPGKRNVRTWKMVGLATEVTATGLSLIPGKTYYFTVKAQNNLRMWSKKGNSNGITVTGDTTSPTGSVIINSDSQYTNSSSVNLSLLAQDNAGGTGLDKMRFSNDNTSWSAWENYSTTKSWGLSAGDGAKTVYAQFNDKAGNASASASDDIILDTTPPVADAGADQAGDIGAEVFFDGSGSFDNYGIVSYSWNFGDGSPTASGVNVSHTYTSAGEYTVTLSVTDVAGNGPVSDIAEVTVSGTPTDNHPPVLAPIGDKFFYINVPEALAQGISPFAGSNLQIEPEIFGSGYKPEPAEAVLSEKTPPAIHTSALSSPSVGATRRVAPTTVFNKLTKSPVTDEPSLPTTSEPSLRAEGEAISSLSFAPNWPITTGGAVFSSPAVGDLDADGDLEIVIGPWDGKLYAFHHNGDPVLGWPVSPMPATDYTHIESSPVICDLDGDGDMEVVVGSGDNGTDSYLSVYNHNGALLIAWPKQVTWSIRSSPAVGDIDGDGEKEIVVASLNDKVYAFNYDGTLVIPGWPLTINTAMNSSPALGDIDGDRDLEIVIGSWDSRVYAFRGNGDLVSDWPRQTLSLTIECSSAIGDIDGDGKMEVVIADSRNNWLYAWKGDGTNVPDWPVEFPASQTSSPALGDIDGDGDIEIVIGGFDGNCYAFHHNGTPVSGWPVATTAGRIESSPSLGDIDGDTDIEVVFSSYDGNAYALHHDGALVSGWPVPIGESGDVSLPYPDNSRRPGGCFGIDCFPLSSSPAIADLDGDGDMEIIIGSSDKNVYVIEQPGIPVNPFSQEWSKYRGRLKNTGFYPRKDLIFKVSAADEDSDTLTYSAFNLPPGAEFDPQTRTFKWTPFTSRHRRLFRGAL